jgi:hypothetical protein
VTHTRVLALCGAILAAAAFRLVPHPLNFSPVGAMAIFGGACLADRRLALAFPLVAMFLSDLFIGLYAFMPVVYGCFLVNVLLGRWLRSRRTVVNTAAVTLAGSIQFFVVTNLADWLYFYPHTAAGLAECFTLAIPYFQNTLAGDATFAVVLFGGLAVAERGFPVLREPAPQPIPVAA